MKTLNTYFLSISLLFSTFLIYVIWLEQGDINSIGLYLVLFLIPIIILGFLNGLILEFAEKRKTNLQRRLWGLGPIILMILLIISKIRILDADIWFLGILAIPTFGLTIVIWKIKLNKK
ncbi:hypothetical protein HZR84_01345 [Hyphobacterium sp. CCMP332]|nr:hypothetical protein HZR84_01345 [Hyphobacterium sp. CCMP332]